MANAQLPKRGRAIQSGSNNGPALILVLGDQLTPDRNALKGAVPGRDFVVMAEVSAEARYVRHNRHKIVLIFFGHAPFS